MNPSDAVALPIFPKQFMLMDLPGDHLPVSAANADEVIAVAGIHLASFLQGNLSEADPSVGAICRSDALDMSEKIVAATLATVVRNAKVYGTTAGD